MAALGRPTTEPSSDSIQKMLDENAQLIQAIVEKQNKGRAFDAMQYQQLLYRNLLVLANLADPNTNLRDILPKPNLYMQQGPAAPSYPMQSGMGVGQRPTMPSTSQGNPYPMGMPPTSHSAAAIHRQTMGQADPNAGHYPPPGASRPPAPPQGGYQPTLPSAVSQGHPPGMSHQEDAMKQQMAMQMHQHAQMLQQQQQQQQGGVAAPRGMDHLGGAPSSSMPPPSYGQHRGPGQF